MLSTILTGDIAEYEAEQRAAIDVFRGMHPSTERARVSVSRSILPATSPERARRYAAYDADRRAHGPRRPARAGRWRRPRRRRAPIR